MKETKKMKFTECLSHLFVFIKPYRPSDFCLKSDCRRYDHYAIS